MSEAKPFDSLTAGDDVQSQLNWGRDQLREAGIDGAERDARWIMGHVLGVGADRVPLHTRDRMAKAQCLQYLDAVIDRCDGRPVSQITGQRAFYGRSFAVNRHVLDPRPETEELVAMALDQPFRRVLDLGTGSGCILGTLLAERPEALGVGSDISVQALEVAMVNVTQLAVADRGDLVTSDWFKGVVGHYDLIVSNPPYISADEFDALMPDVRQWEPRMALTPGGDGLEPYRIIAANAPSHLSRGGRLLVEIGPTQAAPVQSMFVMAGLEQVTCHRDINGKDRIVSAVRR